MYIFLQKKTEKRQGIKSIDSILKMLFLENFMVYEITV